MIKIWSFVLMGELPSGTDAATRLNGIIWHRKTLNQGKAHRDIIASATLLAKDLNRLPTTSWGILSQDTCNLTRLLTANKWKSRDRGVLEGGFSLILHLNSPYPHWSVFNFQATAPACVVCAKITTRLIVVGSKFTTEVFSEAYTVIFSQAACSANISSHKEEDMKLNGLLWQGHVFFWEEIRDGCGSLTGSLVVILQEAHKLASWPEEWKQISEDLENRDKVSGRWEAQCEQAVIRIVPKDSMQAKAQGGDHSCHLPVRSLTRARCGTCGLLKLPESKGELALSKLQANSLQ